MAWANRAERLAADSVQGRWLCGRAVRAQSATQGYLVGRLTDGPPPRRAGKCNGQRPTTGDRYLVGRLTDSPAAAITSTPTIQLLINGRGEYAPGLPLRSMRTAWPRAEPANSTQITGAGRCEAEHRVRVAERPCLACRGDHEVCAEIAQGASSDPDGHKVVEKA